MDLSLYDLYRELKMKRILFCYSGPVAQASIEGVGSTLRRNLEFEETGKMTQMAVFSTFIEQIQNVLNYSAEKLGPETDSELRVGVTVVGHDEFENYCVYCGNRVYNSDIPHIRRSIDSLSGLTKEELKSLYKERRREGPPAEGGKGAGLGMIEMARRALKPLEYSFEPIDGTMSFFSILVVIGRA